MLSLHDCKVNSEDNMKALLGQVQTLFYFPKLLLPNFGLQDNVMYHALEEQSKLASLSICYMLYMPIFPFTCKWFFLYLYLDSSYLSQPVVIFLCEECKECKSEECKMQHNLSFLLYSPLLIVTIVENISLLCSMSPLLT